MTLGDLRAMLDMPDDAVILYKSREDAYPFYTPDFLVGYRKVVHVIGSAYRPALIGEPFIKGLEILL